MVEKQNEKVRRIIYCKNYLGLDVFNNEDKKILIDLYGLYDIALEPEIVCVKYSVDIDYLNELTRTYENVKEAFEIEKKEKVLKRK